mmetsp:Transcript_39060/g.83371  ORF Transcript_39060/g.83371 Transcript_39060/m.83371 type:complete len:215 (-) Transcript_39060:175-819(-)
MGCCDQPKGSFGQVTEAKHDSLRYASTATRVNDGSHFLRLALFHLLDFLTLGTIRPLVILQSGRTQREGNALHALGNAVLHFVPRLLVKLSHEQKLCLAMLQRVLGGLRRQRGVNWHSHVAGHHDRQVGHEPPGAVLAHDGDLTRHGEVKTLDVGGHLLGFGEELAEGPVLDDVAAHGLREERLGRVRGADVEGIVGDDLALLLLDELGCHVDY